MMFLLRCRHARKRTERRELALIADVKLTCYATLELNLRKKVARRVLRLVCARNMHTHDPLHANCVPVDVALLT